MEYKKLQGFAAGLAASGVLATIITLVLGVIGLQVLNTTISATNYNATPILYTVVSNVPILFSVGLLVAAIGWAFLR